MTRAPASARRIVQYGAATACSTETTRMPSSAAVTSERFGKAERVRGHVRENQIRRDGRDLIEARLAKLLLDVELLGEPVAGEGLQAHVGRVPRRVCGEQLGDVRFRAARYAVVEHLRGFVHHERRGFRLGGRARDRELHALVRADGPAEHLALARVAARAIDEVAGVADALGGDENTLSVHPIEDVPEALALLADEIAGGHAQLIEEQLGRRMID